MLAHAHHRSQPDPLADVSSEAFAGLLEKLLFQTELLETVAKRAEDRNEALSPSTLSEALDIYGRGIDLVRTLKTVCRLHLGLNTSDTTAVAARSQANALSLRLEKAVEPLFDALEKSTPQGRDAAKDDALRLWARTRRENVTFRENKELRAYTNEIASSVISPIAALHAHLTSTMSIEAMGEDGRTRALGFGTAVSVLKNDDDPMMRQTTFKSFNAWLASHAASFLDVLNAMGGFRWAIFKRSAPSGEVFNLILKSERTDRAVYDAMFEAISEALPAIRETVTLRQAAFGGGPMKVWNILSPAPGARFSSERRLEDALEAIIEAGRALSPDFSGFVRNLAERGWLYANGISRKTGGGWADDLPAAGEVRVLTDYLPTYAGQGTLAHLIGAAYQMHVMHDAPAPARLYPLSMTEVFANTAETTLFAHLAKEAHRRGSAEDLSFLCWQSLRRLTNCLLVLPARHRLARAILAERGKHALSLNRINALSIEAWRHYFGDTTDGEDRYVWAYKQHFYRTRPVYYDWQYTLGFLLSKALHAQFSEHGQSACGASFRACCLESGRLTVDEFGRRHLGADLRRKDFWAKTIHAALEVVRFCKNANIDFGLKACRTDRAKPSGEGAAHV